MNKVKAWNASNSRAITKFHDADIGYFELKMLIHELIRGFLGLEITKRDIDCGDNLINIIPGTDQCRTQEPNLGIEYYSR